MSNSGQDGQSSGLDQAVMEAKLTRWAEWPVGSGRGGAYLVRFVSITAAIAAAIVGITWLFAKGGEDTTPLCSGREMQPGDTCIFYNPERTLNYDQMVQRAADTQSHPFAWTITIVVLVIAALMVAGELIRQWRARTPTTGELEEFMARVNSARMDLEAKVAADPRDPEARRELAVFDRAVARFATENDFRVVGSRAILN